MWKIVVYTGLYQKYLEFRIDKFFIGVNGGYIRLTSNT